MLLLVLHIMKIISQFSIIITFLLIIGACSPNDRNNSENYTEEPSQHHNTKKVELDVRDIDNLLAESKRLNRPILLFFTGYNCVNCRKMEEKILHLPQIEKKLNDEFLFVSFYNDSRVKLKKEEYLESTRKQKIIKTVGALNYEYEIMQFNQSGEPTFVGLDASNNTLGITTYELTNTDESFIIFLDEVMYNFKTGKQVK